MNKIFKVIFSKAKGCYVVVSELAKSTGGGTPNLKIKKGYSLTLAAAVMSMFLGVAPVGAADTVDLGNGGSAAYDDKGNLTIGKVVQGQSTDLKGENNTAIGTKSDTLRNITEGETTKNGQPMDEANTKLVDGEGAAHKLDTSTESGGSTAVGYNNKAEGDNSTAIGNTAKITNKPITYYADKDGNKTTSTDDAAWYKDSSGNPTEVPQVFRDANGNTTTTPQYVHTYTEKDSTTGEEVTKTEITSDDTKADQKDGKPVYNYRKSDNLDKLYSVTLYQAASNSIAAGSSVTANGNNAVAVGYNSTADNSAVAVGDTAVASGDNTIAIGTKSKAADSSGKGSIAIGKGVEANGSSTAVGLNGTKATYGSSAYGNNAVAQNSSAAFGSNIQASNGSYASGNNVVAQNSSAAFGSNIQASSGSYASGIGTTDKPVVATGSSYATGMGGTTATNGSMAMGNNVSAGKNGGGAFAVGMGGTTANSGSMAVGNNVKAGENSGGAFAVGMGGTSADGSSMAVGDNVHATGSAFASGRNGTSAQSGGIAYGDNVSAQYGGFAAGTNSTSANSGVAVGSNVHAYDGSSYAGGMNNTTAGNGSIAFGNNVHAGNSSGGAFAAGMNGTTADGSSVAVGDNVHASNGSYAAGMGGTSASSSAVAVGNNAYAYGNSYAFGSSAHADSSSAAIGNSSYATNGSLALGNSAGAYVSGGIALGSNSKAYRGSGTTGLDPRTGKAYTDTSDKTWNSTYGALSIGNVDSDGTVNGTRQIIGVAAGTNDTDAVNVAQLKAAMTQSGSIHDYSVNSTDTAADTNYNNAGATGKNALAAGVSASATTENAVAIGYGAKADGVGATVIGQYGKATGQYALAFGGVNTDSTGTPVDNTASGFNSVAFGERTAASGNNSTAFGWQTTATQKRATAFGERTTASGANSTAFGQLAVASGQNSTAFGNEAVANNYGTTAFGNRTEALGEYSTAFGNSTVAAGMNTVAFGTDNVAGAVLDDNGAYTNIIYKTNTQGRIIKDTNGNPIEISREKMDARGNLAYTDSNGNTKSVTYTVSGGETHSYVLLQGEDGNTYIRDYRGNIRSAAIGSDGTVTVGDTTDAVLKKATAGANGYHILSNANATVWGENSIASGEASTAFGIDSTASGKNSVAIGGATASLNDSIALGKGSVTTRAKYSELTKDAEKAAYGKGSSTGSAWEATDNAIAVGNDSTTTRQITGVAAGSLDTDAVNVAQLRAVDARHTTVSVGGQKATADNTVVQGGNMELTRTTSNGQANFDVSLNKDVTLGKQEEDKGGSLVVNSVAQFRKESGSKETYPVKEAVKIDGTTVSVVKNDGTNDQRQVVLGVGQDTGGYVALFDNTGKKPTYIFNAISSGITYLKDKNTYPEDEANEFNRLEYGDIYNGSTQFIATLDDGLKFAGDQGSMSAVKLNQKLSVTGGVTDPSSLSTANNIGVVSSQDGEDGKLELRLNKDLSGLNSVTAGNVHIGNNPANTLKLTENGQETENTAPAGNYVTGLDNKAWDTKNPSYVSGRGATEDQLAIVSGVVDKGLSFTANTRDATNTTDNYAGYKVVNRQLGDTISIKAGDADPNKKYVTTNLTTDIANNGDITISMAESPTFNIVTATSLDLSPKDTTTKDKNGYTASAQLDAHYRGGSLDNTKNVTMADGSTGMVRLHYHDGEGTIHDLATMDDGQVYAGDIKEDGTLDTTGFGRRMNEKTTINGGVKAKDDLTDNNIGVVSNGTDTLTVKLAKRLTNLESVQAGKTTIDDNGLTIKKSDDDSSKNIVVLGDKVAFGDTQVNNMGSGSDGTDADGNPTYNTLTNGANIGDVKNIASSTVQPVIDTVNKGWELDVNGTKQKDVTPTSPKVNFIQGQNITITGDTTNTENVTIATADDVRFNTVRVGGVKTGDTYSGGIMIGVQSGKNADGTESANSSNGNYITGLDNRNWDSTKIQHGRAATEDQLLDVATKIQQGSVAGDIYVTGGSVTYNGEGSDTNPKDGKGSINLTRQNGTDVPIKGLHDYYITDGMVTNDGKTLELTRNDVDGDGNHQKITVDLSNVLSNDQHLVTNPDAADGKYTVNTTDGTVTLKVKNGNKYDDITIGGFEGLGQGLKFGANKMAKDGGGNPVTNQLGSTINITGAGTKELDKYSGQNLMTSVEQDADGNTTIHVLMDKNISADGVTVGQAGRDGVAGADGEIGQAGTIGINGKNGVKGEDGKEGITTTIIRTEKGQSGEKGATGKPGVDGKDITRIVYQNDQDKVDGKDGSHTVATLDDGLKFSGDDNTVIRKKLNEQLQFVGGANKLTQNNIGVVEKDGKLWIQLAETPDLGTKGNLKAGDAQIGWFNGDVLSKTDGTKEKQGSYATGLDNKDWSISNPSYVSGRAATEDQLAKVSKAISNATTAAGKRTVVTVNDKANPAEATPKDGDYGDYDSTNGNLMIAAKKDTYGVLTYNIKLNDNLAIGQKGENGKDGKVTVDTKGGTTVVIGHDGEPGKDGKDGISVKGQDGKDGVTITAVNGKDGTNGTEGHIGLTGPAGKDGKAASADIHVKNGQNGVDGTDGNNGKDGMDRIVYEDHNGKPHEVATMDDGLKFAGDDISKTVDKKLNETLQIRGDGTYDKTTQKTKADGNIQISADKDTGTVKVALNKDINLKQNGSLTVGGDTQDGSTTVEDPIIIKHFDAGKLTVTGTDKNGNTPQSKAGDYVTGLDNKDWDVTNPTYVSGRAATEDQLKVISDEIKNTAATASQHTEITVNDKNNPTTVPNVGTDTYGDYGGTGNGNLSIAAKKDTKSGKTIYNIKLNDQLAIGQKGEPGVAGKDGKDGKVTVETSKGTTVVIGHDGEPGKDGKDGISVKGKDGKDGITITAVNGKDGTNGTEGHIGLTGPAGKNGKNVSADIHVKNGQNGVDGTDGNNGKDGMDRIVYEDHNGKTHEVATMDDGLKFVGNDGQEVTRKLNETLSIKGGLSNADVANASPKNLGVRSNKDGNGLEIVMTDTPDFTKVTVGGDKKITIGGQTNSDTKNPDSGNYITGLDNTKWDKDHVTENRVATEGQLRDVAGSITNQANGGGFALTSDEKGADKIVKQDLGKAIQIKGDTTYKADGTVEKAGNIKTSIDNGAIKVELSKDVDLGDNGSVKAGNTTINSDGVDTNKVTIKDSTISISKDGINAGGKQITDVASGASEIIKGTGGRDVYKYDNDTNAANIGDVKRIAGEVKSDITNVTKNVTDVTNKVTQMGDQVTQVKNDVKQLQQDVKADRQYQGDDAATKKNVNVKFGKFLSLTGGAKVTDLTEEGNIGVVQKEIPDPDNPDQKMTGLSVRLAKHLNLEKTTYTTNENGKDYTSEIDGKGFTIKTGDANRTITVQDGNVNMGGNQIHDVAPGKAPTDAVNVSQLAATNQNISNLGGEVNKLGTRVNRVGANAAALAALHPLDFDPDDKWDFAAGYGNYKNANAAAIGAYYRPNEDTMFSVGGSFGGGENMVNAGISVKLGQGNHVSTSRVAMAKEIKDLRKDVADLKAVVNQQSALIDKLTGVNAGQLSGSDDLFPDVPANHWAYEYVTKLKQAGILTGYPDGNFAGDRMMTRYEFAAIVYRAIMAGAAANPNLNKDDTLDRLAKEFSGEMKYIRIDTIRKDRNGKPTIQRVRVIKEEEK
ncbi:ESPR-type extended signal peptide-containing protein [uncultured Dialister sp.]|uniref:ESPR-type extended signal peptide-containing protein n=1 Tax=uncultured Dialister sp. TaxID=278064 RepID=UPI0025F7150C|nr:ESPR-type extended signal peptide-containing protein [uncultured Dialister sp.]